MKEHMYLWSIYFRSTTCVAREGGLSLDKLLTDDYLLRLVDKLRKTDPGSAPSIMERYKHIKKKVIAGPHLCWTKICPNGKPIFNFPVSGAYAQTGDSPLTLERRHVRSSIQNNEGYQLINKMHGNFSS